MLEPRNVGKGIFQATAGGSLKRFTVDLDSRVSRSGGGFGQTFTNYDNAHIAQANVRLFLRGLFHILRKSRRS